MHASFICCPHSFHQHERQPISFCTNQKPTESFGNHSTSSPRISTRIRRRRLIWHARANIERDEGDYDVNRSNEKSDEKNREGESSSTDDTEPSNITLPDLRELFTSAGDPNCGQCKGKGSIECPICNGNGYFILTMMETTSATTCRMCRGRRSIPCPSCRAIVFKSILWWDRIPSQDDDPDENWRKGPDGPRIDWGGPPNKL